MSLDKAIEHGKEKRRQYWGAKSFDSSCRNHGGCPYCEGSRQRQQRQLLEVAEQEMAEMNKRDERVLWVTIQLREPTWALIQRIAREYGEPFADEVASIVETWAQQHRDTVCDRRDEGYDYDEQFNPETEGYCSHHWHWPDQYHARVMAEVETSNESDERCTGGDPERD